MVGGGYYAPYYYDPFFSPIRGTAISIPTRPYGYAYHPIAPDSSVRLDVKPKEAEVYVDGYYAGVVDDFDGTFQRLRVEPGEHEIELWLDGYRTVKQKVYLTPDNTFKIKYQMERLAAGEAPEPKPQPPQPQGGYQPPDGGYQPRMQPPMPPPPGSGPTTRRVPPPQQMPPQQQPTRGSRAAARATRPTARSRSRCSRVTPRCRSTANRGAGRAGQDRLIVEVAEGSHTVEIRKAGYRTYVTQVDVHRGQTTPLNVSLRGEQQ